MRSVEFTEMTSVTAVTNAFSLTSNDIYFTVFPLFLARLVQSRGTSEFQVLLVPGIVRQ